MKGLKSIKCKQTCQWKRSTFFHRCLSMSGSVDTVPIKTWCLFGDL